jgi:hypothetical protein
MIARTSEEVLGVPQPALKELLRRWRRRPDGAPGLTELSGLFASGVYEARLAAVELARSRRSEWDASWAELFTAWARSSDTSSRVADGVGENLLGPLALEGRLPAGTLEGLAASASVWPWRAGLAALRPSLERGGRDWPLFETFAAACVGEDGRLGRERAALNAFRSCLRRALKGCPEKVRDFLARHEPELPGLLEAVEGGGEREED